MLCWFTIVAVIWLGWQLLRQSGRLLLRLEELEKRLDELEFGEGEEPKALALGTEAPAFELADLTGERKSLAQFRGQSVWLIFFNPDCGYCRELMPKLAALFGVRRQAERDAALDAEANTAHPSQSAVTVGAVQNFGGLPPGEQPMVLIVTTGDAEKNRPFFAQLKLDYPVLLQNDGEVAKAYQVHGTPTGYLISAHGKIASELAIGAEALLKLASASRSSRRMEAQTSVPQPSILNSQPEEQSLLTSAATDSDSCGNRFSHRSLARSKIKRDGLKAGTPAPDFRLPRLDGRGDLTLSELRGKPMLLVFSSPHCGPCNALAPELEKFHRKNEGRARHSVRAESPTAESGAQRTDAPYSINVVMISKGEPKENRAKVKEHGLTFPVVLQQQWEISRRYAMFATPIAYLIDEAGVVINDVAVGTDAILELMTQTKKPRPERLQEVASF